MSYFKKNIYYVLLFNCLFISLEARAVFSEIAVGALLVTVLRSSSVQKKIKDKAAGCLEKYFSQRFLKEGYGFKQIWLQEYKQLPLVCLQKIKVLQLWRDSFVEFFKYEEDEVVSRQGRAAQYEYFKQRSPSKSQKHGPEQICSYAHIQKITYRALFQKVVHNDPSLIDNLARMEADANTYKMHAKAERWKGRCEGLVLAGGFMAWLNEKYRK